MTTVGKMSMLTELAQATHGPTLTDLASPAQLRAWRQIADAIVASFGQNDVPVTVDTLFAFTMGAAMQSSVHARSPLAPMQKLLTGEDAGSPSSHLIAAVGYIAADLLDGRL
jgi:hypothetical protein